MCVIADASGERPIGLGGVMGGASTGCSEATTDGLHRERLFRPDHHRPRRCATTGHQLRRRLSLRPRRRYRHLSLPGLELATKLILETCAAATPSGRRNGRRGPGATRRAVRRLIPHYVQQLAGLDVPGRCGTRHILTDLGFQALSPARRPAPDLGVRAQPLPGHPAQLATRRGRQGRHRRGDRAHRDRLSQTLPARRPCRDAGRKVRAGCSHPVRRARASPVARWPPRVTTRP